MQRSRTVGFVLSAVSTMIFQNPVLPKDATKCATTERTGDKWTLQADKNGQPETLAISPDGKSFTLWSSNGPSVVRLPVTMQVVGSACDTARIKEQLRRLAAAYASVEGTGGL